MNRAKNQTATSTDDLQDDAPGFDVWCHPNGKPATRPHSTHDSIDLAKAAVAAFWKNTEDYSNPCTMTITDPSGAEVFRKSRGSQAEHRQTPTG